MFKLGLTGSIGMGKSTTAKMFAAEGCAVWDADDAVHRLYDKGGAAVEPIRHAFPLGIEDGAVSRSALKQIIAGDPMALMHIEAIVHPLVAMDRMHFLKTVDADIAVLDVPLLFETGGDADMDATACVTVSARVQKDRVLSRGSMTEAQFEQILEHQMPNDKKCARADFVIETDTLEHAQEQVRSVVETIRERLANA